MTNKKQRQPINNKKIKDCVLAIWGHLLFVTWVILRGKITIYIQASSLLLLFVSIYLQLVLIQDYLFIKKHTQNEDFRQDIRVLEPILPERYKRHDAQT